MAELRGQHSIRRGRRSAALDVAEDRGAGFQSCCGFDCAGQYRTASTQTDRIRASFHGSCDRHVAVSRAGAFRHADDAESLALAAPLDQQFVHLRQVVWNFRDEDDVRSACDPGAERQPAGVASHHFDHHHAVMAHRGGVDLVQAFPGRLHRGVKAEGLIASFQIIVDRLGHADAVDAVADEIGRAGHGAIAADADDRIEFVRRDMFDDAVRDVCPFRVAVAFNCVFFRIGFVAGSENRAALGEDIGDILPLERMHAVLDEPEESIFDAKDFQFVPMDRRFGDSADDRIKPGAVAAAGENADSFDCACHKVCHSIKGLYGILIGRNGYAEYAGWDVFEVEFCNVR